MFILIHINLLNGAKNFQIIQLDREKGCVVEKTIIHELVHALGFNHEHERPDRDSFITVNYHLIKENWHSQYEKQTHSLTFGVCFNPKSVMHYPSGRGKDGTGWEVESEVCKSLITLFSSN